MTPPTPAADSAPHPRAAARPLRPSHATALGGLRPSRHRGVTLIESLIALLVASFSGLALVGMQSSLSRHAEIAKQRSEAVRFAQARMESLRSAASLSLAAVEGGRTPGAGDTGGWAALPLAVQTPLGDGQTRFEVDSALGGSDADPMRSALVTVRWLDRTGLPAASVGSGQAHNQQVQLASVITLSDPRETGLLGNPLPPQAQLKRPGDRSLAIPRDALRLGEGRSAVQIAADLVAVLDDATGELRQVCNPEIVAVTADRIKALLAAGACSALKGHVVSGHIGRGSADIPWPTGIATAELLRQNPAAGWGIRCKLSEVLDPASGGPLTEGHGSRYYLCVIPLQAPHAWSGTLRLGGVPTTGDLLVCRFESAVATLAANDRNVQPYENVRTSLRDQNFLIVKAPEGICPAAMMQPGFSVGVPHQDCRAGRGGATEAVCPPATR